jgi:hypothetical protein
MEWLTYREAAAALGLPSPSAAKYRAMRGRWPKRLGNDGLARIQLPEHPVRTRSEPSASASRTECEPVAHPERTEFAEAIITSRDQLTAAIERETRLTADLAAERARADREAAKTAQEIAAFESLAQRLVEGDGQAPFLAALARPGRLAAPCEAQAPGERLKGAIPGLRLSRLPQPLARHRNMGCLYLSSLLLARREPGGLIGSPRSLATAYRRLSD